MITVAIFYTNQCDSKKCTSVKINNFKDKLSFKTLWLLKQRSIRKNSIVLTPNSDSYLMYSDNKLVERVGITLLDCSWNEGDKYLKEWKFQNGRILPPLLAGNPVNYGKWSKLTSLEALASAFYILGYENYFKELLDLYNWGKSFYDLNIGLLSQYKACKNKDDINIAYQSYLQNKQQ